MATDVSFFKTFADSLVGTTLTLEREGYDLDFTDTDNSLALEGVTKVVVDVATADIVVDRFQPEFFELKVTGEVSEVNGSSVTPYNCEVANINLNEVHAEITTA